MIEYQDNREKQLCVCTTEKLKNKVFIEKEPGGNIFFKFRFEVGVLPKVLSGRYTSMKKAKEALEKYLRNKSKSKSIKRDEYAEDFMKRKKVRDASESKSKSS